MLIPVVIFAGSALIFGGISALAVFASGGNDFAFPVAACDCRRVFVFRRISRWCKQGKWTAGLLQLVVH